MVLLRRPYFLSYISAKYYLNWFSFHIVIVKVTGVNFFETQCRSMDLLESGGLQPPAPWLVRLLWPSIIYRATCRRNEQSRCWRRTCSVCLERRRART